MKNSPSRIVQAHSLLLHSPYLLYSRSYLSNEYRPLYLVLDRLTGEEYNQELLKTISGKELLTYRQLVAGEFIRQFLNSRFPYWQSSEKLKPLLNLELNLWITVLKMLKELQVLCPSFINCHFAIFFKALVVERKLIVLIGFDSEQSTIKGGIGLLQSQNRKLQGCENPFTRDEAPRTWEFIQQAITIADQNDDFRREFYMPIVRARQKFVAYMQDEKFRIYKQGQLQRQGRRKSQKNKRNPESLK